MIVGATLPSAGAGAQKIFSAGTAGPELPAALMLTRGGGGAWHSLALMVKCSTPSKIVLCVYFRALHISQNNYQIGILFFLHQHCTVKVHQEYVYFIYSPHTPVFQPFTFSYSRLRAKLIFTSETVNSNEYFLQRYNRVSHTIRFCCN